MFHNASKSRRQMIHQIVTVGSRMSLRFLLVDFANSQLLSALLERTGVSMLGSDYCPAPLPEGCVGRVTMLGLWEFRNAMKPRRITSNTSTGPRATIL